MEENYHKKIQKKLEDFELRLSRLEKANGSAVSMKEKPRNKQKTLREIIKGKKLKNGQECVAAVVGYHELIVGLPITKDKIKEEWVNAKMINKFSAEFISRAKDTFIRIHPDETCDLTQTGENFFDELLSGSE